jgi:hydrogenase small subunit
MTKRPPERREWSGELDRRDFLRLSAYAACWVPLAGCVHGSPGQRQPGPAVDKRTPVLWLETGTCTGCACSLLGCPAPPAEVLLGQLRLEFQETLSADFGSAAIDRLLGVARAQARGFVLVVDGAIPVRRAERLTTLGVDGRGADHTAASLVASLAGHAARVVALGTCASFGGIPGSAPGTGAHVSVAEVIGATPVRVPGCPPNPFWIVGALTMLLRGKALALDSLGRPKAYFGATVHDLCPRRERFAAGEFAAAPGDPTRCLSRVGCKGMMAKGDCPSRLWQGRSYCIKAGHPCIGCTAPGFLDGRPTVDGKDVGLEGQAAAPFYQALEV